MEKILSELKPKEFGKIKKVYSGEGTLHKKLLDMGIIKGTEIEVIRVAPLGDPIEIKIKGYYLSLRKQEASQIVVEISNAQIKNR